MKKSSFQQLLGVKRLTPKLQYLEYKNTILGNYIIIQMKTLQECVNSFITVYAKGQSTRVQMTD